MTAKELLERLSGLSAEELDTPVYVETVVFDHRGRPVRGHIGVTVSATLSGDYASPVVIITAHDTGSAGR